ncbi:MAG: hypothetical protein IPO69_00245 [Saprospiraceae bacterium]|nr:hypothetical protein [Saprospiraceae bacterium]
MSEKDFLIVNAIPNMEDMLAFVLSDSNHLAIPINMSGTNIRSSKP